MRTLDFIPKILFALCLLELLFLCFIVYLYYSRAVWPYDMISNQNKRMENCNIDAYL